MAFKPLVKRSQGEKFKFENEGDSLVGHYLGSEIIEINGEPATKHNFSTSRGLVSPLGSADLNSQLNDVPSGMMTKVVYTGKKTIVSKKNGKKFQMKTYSIEVDESDVINEGTLSSAPTSEKTLG